VVGYVLGREIGCCGSVAFLGLLFFPAGIEEFN